MSAVREHHCGVHVYDLRGPDGPLLLDSVAVGDTATGPALWLPKPDGRTCVRSGSAGWGHREHRCVPEGQGSLL